MGSGCYGTASLALLLNSQPMCLEDAIGQYYDDYYKKARSYELLYPDNVKIFDTSELNIENGVRSILEFVGVENPNIVVGIKKNVTAEIEGV